MANIHPQKKHKKKALHNSDPGKILDLVMSLYDESCAELQVKINTYITAECEAELAFMVIIHSERKEAFIEAVGITCLPRKFKISMSQKLIEVMKNPVEQSELLSTFEPDFQEIINPFIKEAGKKRVLMESVYDKPFSVIMCVVAPKIMEDQAAILIHECYLALSARLARLSWDPISGRFAWPTLKKTIILEYECTLKNKCQQLLRVAKRLFTQVASLDTLLHIAMDQVKQLTRAQFCIVKLVDVDTMELVESCPPAGRQPYEGVGERRFPMNLGIAGQVIKTGHLVNCKVAKDNPAFNESIDTLPGVECRNLLCFPIREQTGIIGVGQLINKVQDPYFDIMDEEMALAFSIYCGICIVHSVVYERVQEAHIRNALANELVMYHMKVGDSEVARMIECTGFHNHPHFSSLHFNPRALPMRELPCYALRMFSDLGLDQKFHLKPTKLARFILHVKKGYRDVPYHSWLHAFNVAQWAYAACVNYKLLQNGLLTDLQMLMFLIAGLVHDLDHRGTTNSFHMQGQTTLAALYSSEGSVMERHHLAQAMCILNTEGCDILESLSRRDYDKSLMLLRDFILASDLANFFKNIKEYQQIASEFQRGNRVHNSTLMTLLMNAADLSDQLKDWGSVKKTAAAVLTEFFKQGDVEKSRGELPQAVMDREKCFIPDLEMQFLTNTCIPLFDMIGRVIPKAAQCLKIIENHIERWDAAKPVFAEVPITAGLSVLLSPELDTLIEYNLIEKERLAKEAAEKAAAEAEEALATKEA